jgi:hypothetical protein
MDDTQSYLDALQQTSDVNDYISNLQNEALQKFEDLKKQPIEAIGSILGVEAAQRLGSSLLDIARNQGAQWSKGVARSAMQKAGVAEEDIDEILKGNVSGVMKQKVQSLIDKAKSKVEDVKNDVQDAIQDKVDAVKGKISDIQNQAEDAVNDARNTAEDFVNTARNTAEDLVDTARNTVSDAASSVEGAVNDARNLGESVVGDVQNVAQNTLSSARNTLSSAQESLTNVASDVQQNVGTLTQRIRAPEVELPDFDDIATLENPLITRNTSALNPLEQQDYMDVLNGEPTIASNLSEELYNEAYGARQILLQKGVAIPKSGETSGTLPERGGFTEPVEAPGTSSNQIGRLLQQDKLKKQAQEQQEQQETQETESTPETPPQSSIQETNIDEAFRQQQEQQETPETTETPETAPETPETAPDVVPEVASETESIVPKVAPEVATEGESVVPKVAGALEDAGEAAEGTGIGDLIAPALVLGGVLASIFGVSESSQSFTPINPSTQFV